MKYIFLIAFTFLISFSSYAQKKKVANDSQPNTGKLERELYLNKIRAAEALFQLNEIAETKSILESCGVSERGLEWRILNSMVDRSIATVNNHKKSVTAISISPDGKLVATGSADSTIMLFDFATRKVVNTLKGHKGQVSTLDFSPDGRLLASGSTDKSVKLWEASTGNEIATFMEEFSQGIYQLKFNPTGDQLAVCSWEMIKGKQLPVQGFAKIIRLSDGKLLKRFDQDAHPSSTLDFSPDGKKLMVATWGFIMYYYDLDTDKLEWTYELTKPDEYTAMNSADISDDGKWIVLGTKDNRVRIIDAINGELVRQIDPWNGHSKWVNTVGFSPDGKYFASGSDDQLLMIWDTETGNRINIFRGHVGAITALAFHPFENKILTTSRDGAIKIWDLENPGERIFDVCNFGPWYAPITNNGIMAAACSDKVIGVWDVNKQSRILSFDGVSANTAALSKNANFLSTGAHDQIVRWFDLKEGKEKFTMKGHTNSIYGIDYLESKDLLISAAVDKTMRIWDIKKGEEIMKIELTDASPYSLVSTPDETQIIAGLTNGKINVYSTDDWHLVKSISVGKEIDVLSIDPTGKKIASGGSGGEVFIVDLITGKTLPLKGHSSIVYGIAFHPSGKYVVSGSYDRTVRLWDAATGECTLTLHGFKDEIFTASFFDDGNQLLITETEGKVHSISIK
jgi:WD40 repeat protein